jgi:biopolymer transport protein ExbD
MRFYVPKQRKTSIIIVSLVDVMTVLLIFFAVATTFKKAQPILKIDLPEAGSGEKVPSQQPIVITVTPPPNERVLVNGEEIALQQLGARLKRERDKDPNVGIALQSDRKASFGLVVRIMDVARSAGFEQLPAFIDENKGAPGRLPTGGP